MTFSPMAKYRMARWSAFLNLLGALLVFLSFQTASTNLLFVTERGTKNVAFCIGDRAVFGLTHDGQGMTMGFACPLGSDAKPAAVINTDSPWLMVFGWSVLVLGFFLQLFSVEKPSSVVIPHVTYGPRQKSSKSK